MELNKEYCYSWDNERYYGRVESEQGAIEKAKRSKPDAESVYIGTCAEIAIQWRSCEEEIIESIIENLADEVGEIAEDFDTSKEDRLILAEMIDKTVEVWIEKYGITSGCYTVLDRHKVLLI